MLSQNTKDALILSKGKAVKATVRPMEAGESRIAPKDWDAITGVCKGEAALFAALKVTDERVKAARE
mgnify:FL=1